MEDGKVKVETHYEGNGGELCREALLGSSSKRSEKCFQLESGMALCRQEENGEGIEYRALLKLPLRKFFSGNLLEIGEDHQIKILFGEYEEKVRKYRFLSYRFRNEKGPDLIELSPEDFDLLGKPDKLSLEKIVTYKLSSLKNTIGE